MAKKKSKSARKSAARKSAARKAPARPPGPAPQSVTPYLAVGDAAGAIDWYKRAFGAKEITRQLEPSGKVMHASLKIGQSFVMLSDIFPGSDMRDPLSAGPSVNLHLYSKDIDKIFSKAVAAGAKVTMPLEDQFWGERYGKLQDPYGHSWGFSWKAKMSAAEMEKKREEAMKSMGAGEQPGSSDKPWQ
jgi:PhnB protein